jgi:RimJ/RimL family protein N-acetyltransferase/predicted GNAT family acetyltransferase
MDLGRIRAFRRTLEDRLAERRVELPFGTGLFCDSLADVYDLNFVRVEDDAPAQRVADAAENAMECFFHRSLEFEPGLVAPAAELTALGWEWNPHLVMALTREPDRRIAADAVREVPFATVEPARTALVLAEPWGTVSLACELNAGRERLAHAVRLRYFAAFDGGEVAGYCELREEGGVAQIEDVNTLPDARGRGLGRALVQVAGDAARHGNDVVFLEALAHDWPRRLYERLGYTTVEERHLFLRRPHALTRLRVRTPRLELRLATVAELRALAGIARDGIHPPDEMPFAVAWTDRTGDPGFEDDFVRFHRAALDGWLPGDWTLHLIAFAGGRPVGVQSLSGAQFAERRTVVTGSWLGRAWQSRGFGTEMRAGALELAFHTLGARVARSGALAGNPRSLRVSQRLGYREVGMSTASPRGIPVPHHDLELNREAFRAPVDVTVEGAEQLRPLFGVR